MSKVKGVEEEEWKHAIGPLTLSELRGGSPIHLFAFLRSTNTKISHKCFFFKHKLNGKTLDGNTSEYNVGI